MSDLGHLLNRIDAPRLLVLGDLILDRYTWGNAGRVSPEAPVLVLNAEEQELRPGGAASVASLLRGLDAEVTPIGVIGDDAPGRQLTKLLDESGIDSTSLVPDSDRPTTTKERFMGRAAGRHPHQILRVDAESTLLVNAKIESGLLSQLTSQLHDHDALLVSDYAKGVCTPRLLRESIKAASRRQVPVIIDPARIDDYSRYTGADVITPNRVEAERASGQRIANPEDAQKIAHDLCRQLSLGAVIVTLDRDGMVLAKSNGDCEHFPTTPRSVYDITGAGDMVLALIGLCCAAKVPLAEAVHLANIAAGLEVERLGVATVTRDEIKFELNADRDGSPNKLVTLEELTVLAERYRRDGQRIVFTNGCFDLLHVGHVQCLQEAAQLGDVLIVAVNCDAIVRRLKGADRPIIKQLHRAAMLSALVCVDHVIIFDEETPHRLLTEIRPDVLVKGGTTDDVVGRETVESYGGKIAVTSTVDGNSTTNLIHQMRTHTSV